MPAIEQHDLAALVARYNRPGPRYTSYPTVPEWQEEMSGAVLQQRLKKLQGTSPLPPTSLYLHIPFCAEICHFCGCNTFKQQDLGFADTYIDYLEREITLYAKHLPRQQGELPAVQMHWGGGTPTFLNEAQIARLYGAVTKHFRFTSEAEISIELDPRVTSDAQAKLLRQLGFNRVSFGVQDLDPSVQQAANRIQPPEVTQHLYDICRELGFSSINFDLVYGLARQTPESFVRTVEQVIRWRPDRIALFSYAHVPWLKPYQRKINATELPPANSKFDTFLMARRRFLAAGYQAIGMDHFALPQDELAQARQRGELRRNFQGYTTLPQTNVYAMGITGISDLGDLYVQNVKKFNNYYELLDAGQFAIHRGYHLSANDQLRRWIVTQLLCNFQLRFAEVARRFGVNCAAYFATELAELHSMQDDGLLELHVDGIRVTALGELFIRNICMVFDDHLRRRQGETRQVFSKTV